MSEHALIAPSNAAAIVACPARLVMSAGVGQHMDGDTTVRDEGTAAHWVAEGWCNAGIMPDVGALAPNGIAVTEHMQQTAREWREHVRSWGVLAKYERRLTVPQVPHCFGTSDASARAVAPNTIWAADLKYGYRPIEPLCYQLACYAGAEAADAGIPLDASTIVHLSIYQPRAWHRAGKLRTATVTGQDVAEMLATLSDAAYQALSPTPEARPGAHCSTCPGRARCPALRDAVHGLAMPVAGQDAMPPEYAEQELAYLQARAELVNAYVSGLALEVEHHIAMGYRPALYEMRRSVGALQWLPGITEDVRRVAGFMGHNIDAPPTLITPTQARAKLGSVVDVYAQRVTAKTKLALLPPADKLFKKG